VAASLEIGGFDHVASWLFVLLQASPRADGRFAFASRVGLADATMVAGCSGGRIPRLLNSLAGPRCSDADNILIPKVSGRVIAAE
ncbi:MAG: hypothetical protein E6660_13560, partial [Bradyrhizobium sp.]|uniref:hypothetical protein n=1 Tax=Bradyrhizobium sp. TaxID=376 RepID=UPI002914FB39